MIGFSALEALFRNVIDTGLVKGVYHSVMLKPITGGGNKPAAPVKGRFEYVGPDDRKGFTCYCRQSGSAEVVEVENLGGCNVKKYRFNVPQRMVFYNALEKRSHDELIAKLTKAAIKTDRVRVNKLVVIPEEILRSEAPTGRFNFTKDAFYFAIEFFVLLDIQADTCQTEIKCEGLPNPFC